MLEERIRFQLMEATKKKNNTAKNILSLALGEIQTALGRGQFLSEKDKVAILVKLAKSNTQTASQLKDGDDRKTTLKEENDILKQFLPGITSEEDTLIFVQPIDLTPYTTTGAAIGAIAKLAKEEGITLNMGFVKTYVENLFGKKVQE